jgi:antitoxin (DNA-binding transcriptional repressor) of toxin-antitoxin stability system
MSVTSAEGEEMVQVTLAEAEARLKQLIETALQGETVVIMDGEQAVRLMPEKPVRRPRQPGSAQGLVWMADDFDAPLDDLNEYM